MKRKFLVVAMFVLTTTFALSNSEVSLHGTFSLGGSDPIDSETSERTHAYFVFEGSAAKSLYEALPGKAVCVAAHAG